MRSCGRSSEYFYIFIPFVDFLDGVIYQWPELVLEEMFPTPVKSKRGEYSRIYMIILFGNFQFGGDAIALK